MLKMMLRPSLAAEASRGLSMDSGSASGEMQGQMGQYGGPPCCIGRPWDLPAPSSTSHMLPPPSLRQHLSPIILALILTHSLSILLSCSLLSCLPSTISLSLSLTHTHTHTHIHTSGRIAGGSAIKFPYQPDDKSPNPYPYQPGSGPTPGPDDIPFSSGSIVNLQSKYFGLFCGVGGPEDDPPYVFKCDQEKGKADPGAGLLVIGTDYMTQKIKDGGSIYLK
jgi:hypothetical protein